MGKGSTRRPSQTPTAEVDQRWEQTFGPKPEESTTGLVDLYRALKPHIEERCRS